jgi:hypothetical protein
MFLSSFAKAMKASGPRLPRPKSKALNLKANVGAGDFLPSL